MCTGDPARPGARPRIKNIFNIFELIVKISNFLACWRIFCHKNSFFHKIFACGATIIFFLFKTTAASTF
jgi:hypothetical protein